MKNGQVRVLTATDTKRKRIIYLLPLFLAAVAIGFLIELSTYETLNFGEIKQAIVQLPYKWNSVKFRSQQRLEEQMENETVIIDLENETGLKMWEEPTLLNLNFSWITNNKDICKVNKSQPSDLRIMPILVHTARSHFSDRLALRKSWGSLPIYKNWDIRFVFLLGQADRGLKPERNKEKYEEQEKKLNEEQNEFGDLVIGSFKDSYHNLTYKHLMGYKWILNFCRNAKFVMKIDDDMFIDIMRWLDWRSADLEGKGKHGKVPDLYCHTFGGTQPIRQVGSKWYASFEDWPDRDYPDYCSGWAYALTVDLIQKIYSVSNDRKMFWVDDVFVTGALMEIAKQKFSFKPEIRHIWGEVTTDIQEYRPMCTKLDFSMKRDFKAVAYVPRGEFFQRDMMCMFNKTLYDNNLL